MLTGFFSKFKHKDRSKPKEEGGKKHLTGLQDESCRVRFWEKKVCNSSIFLAETVSFANHCHHPHLHG